MEFEPEKESVIMIFMPMISCVFAYISFVIIIIAVKLFFGLKTGYKLEWLRIGPFVWAKNKDGKISLKKGAGKSIHLIMFPPDCEPESCPYILYTIMGDIALIIVGVCLNLFAFVFVHNEIIIWMCILIGIFYVWIGFMDLIPFKWLCGLTAGCILAGLKNDIFAKKCYKNFMIYEAFNSRIESYDELPQSFVQEIMSIDFEKLDLSNIFIAIMYAIQIDLIMFQGDYERAIELYKDIVNREDVNPVLKNDAELECILYELSNGASKEIIRKMYNKRLQKTIARTKNTPFSKRFMYVYCKYYYKNFEDRYKKELEEMVDSFYSKADVRHQLELLSRF